MAGLITIDQLLARPGFESIDSAQAQALIDDASALVRDAATPELDAVNAPDAPAGVVAVMVNMIRRGLRNPLGHQSETLGDYSYAAGMGGGGVATLYLTRRERRLVRRAAGKLGASSLTMTTDLPWQPSEPSTVLGEDDLL